MACKVAISGNRRVMIRFPYESAADAICSFLARLPRNFQKDDKKGVSKDDPCNRLSKQRNWNSNSRQSIRKEK